MAKTLISSGSDFEKQIGYSRAVVAGDWIMVSGTTGFDYATMTISADVAEQAEQCLKNIEAALRQADSSLKDVVRVTYVLPNGGEFEPGQSIQLFDSTVCCQMATPQSRIPT